MPPAPQARAQNLTPAAAARLGEAFRLLQSGAREAAQAIVAQVIEGFPSAVDALHLFALCRKAAGDREAAAHYFERARVLAPRHPQILSNYANLLSDMGRIKEALDHYRQAVTIAPDFADGWLNLGLAYEANRQVKEASNVAKHLTRLAPEMPASWDFLGHVSHKSGDETAARAAYVTGLKRAPDNAKLWYNFGVFLQDTAEFEEAVIAFQKARTSGLDTPDLYLNLAEAYYESHHIDKALAIYNDAIARFPRQAQIHYLRAKFVWETGQSGDHLGEVKQALALYPESPDLWGVYFDLLSHHGHFAAILEETGKAQSHCPDAPRLLLSEAIARSALGQDEAATIIFERIIALDPLAPKPRLAFVEHLLKNGAPLRAEKLCSELLKLNPSDQSAWAFRGVAWQLLKDPRADWLLDFETMVRVIEVRPPEEFKDVATFFNAVREELDALHRMQAHPLEQTLRGGTQTNGFLFKLKKPILISLRRQIEQAIERDLAHLPQDPGHPFWGRNTRSFQFKGAWSVKLRSQGYHTNHIHPQGWISSALYIALPDVINVDGTREGRIQFGMPPPELNLPVTAQRVVKPEVGRLVLFPSYMWHGTLPFASSQPRMTVAFDMLPSKR